jgi:tryptophan synthase alpha chain
MNRINELFSEKSGNILSIYFTAGYPTLDSTADIISALTENNVDMIEIGIPFSDPIADGPVIQGSNDKALQNGMTLSLLFQQLADIRAITSVPLILMGYLNPILQFGMTPFLEKASQCGIDGVIIPDLPLTEFTDQYKDLFKHYDIKMIFLITPQTSTDRVKQIDNLADGFIYMVTSTAITGSDKGFGHTHTNYFELIRQMQLSNPVLAGFGIYDKAGFETVCKYVNGAIIGSCFIKALTNASGQLAPDIKNFIQTIRP